MIDKESQETVDTSLPQTPVQDIVPEPELPDWDPRAEVEEEMILEKGDRFAMLTAGCLTVALPVCLLVALIAIITLLLFS